MKKVIALMLGFFYLTSFATTLYIVTPEESNTDNPYILSPQGLNHALLLPTYLYTHLLSGVAPSAIYFLTANPEYMRSNASNHKGCEDPDNLNYLSNPSACYFDTTPFDYLDTSVNYYNKLIFEAHPNTTNSQKLYPSSENALIDTQGYTHLKNDLQRAETQGFTTIILSWPRTKINNVVSALGCTSPEAFSASPGQILKLSLNGVNCSSISLIKDGLIPTNAYPNYMNQNSHVVGKLASATDKYVILIRHGEKWNGDRKGGELTCLGLNRALAAPYYFIRKYGIPNVVIGSSLTIQTAPPVPSPIPNSDFYASRALEKIMPYAVMSHTDIKVLPVNLTGNQLKNSINVLVNTPGNNLIVLGWESANAARIADAMISKNWRTPLRTNTPFYWNANDYEQNIVLHYRCNTHGTFCVLQKDYFINDEDYGDILPSWCGNSANS